MKNNLPTALALFSIATTASAHTTGHGTESAQTVEHMLTSPDHLLMIGSILVVASLFAYKQLRARKN